MKFKIGYIILIFVLSVFSGGNFFVKKEILDGLGNLRYVTGKLEYYETIPSPIDDSHVIRWKLHIKLNNSNKIYKNGFSLLSALDKNKFISQADVGSEISLGVIRNDDKDFYYDIVINRVCLVNKNKLINRLKTVKYGSILGGVIFLIYGIYELRRLYLFNVSRY
jgi:hypothetical protein